MFNALLLAVLTLGIPVLTLAMVVKLDAADGEPVSGRPARALGLPWLDDLLRRVRLGHVMVSLLLTGLLYAAVGLHDPAVPIFLAAAVLAVLFFRAWRQEFVALMACPDDAFPGRNDKLVWAALMVMLPPVGYSCARSYRAALRPEAAAGPGAKPAPAVDLF